LEKLAKFRADLTKFHRISEIDSSKDRKLRFFPQIVRDDPVRVELCYANMLDWKIGHMNQE
jgi:hypothetical protein